MQQVFKRKETKSMFGLCYVVRAADWKHLRKTINTEDFNTGEFHVPYWVTLSEFDEGENQLCVIAALIKTTTFASAWEFANTRAPIQRVLCSGKLPKDLTSSEFDVLVEKARGQQPHEISGDLFLIEGV